MQKQIQVRIVQNNLNKVIIEILSSNKIVSVPKRVFEKRLDIGFYDVTNPSSIPTVI